jgi:hypothetical protein
VYDGESEGVPKAVVLGEIKYSDRQQTFTRGLEELLKYMEFVQKDGYGYLTGHDTEVLGLLITDTVEVNDTSPAGGQVTHISAQSLLTDNTPTDWIPETT